MKQQALPFIRTPPPRRDSESDEGWRRITAASGLPNLWMPKAGQFYRVPEIPLVGSGKRNLRRLREQALQLGRKSEPERKEAFSDIPAPRFSPRLWCLNLGCAMAVSGISVGKTGRFLTREWVWRCTRARGRFSKARRHPPRRISVGASTRPAWANKCSNEAGQGGGAYTGCNPGSHAR